MSKHTPGPWEASECGKIECADGKPIADVVVFVQWDTADGIKEEVMPHKANARLMAAAPEMLRLIQRLTSPYMAEPQYRMDAFINANEIVKQITQGDEID